MEGDVEVQGERVSCYCCWSRGESITRVVSTWRPARRRSRSTAARARLSALMALRIEGAGRADQAARPRHLSASLFERGCRGPVVGERAARGVRRGDNLYAVRNAASCHLRGRSRRSGAGGDWHARRARCTSSDCAVLRDVYYVATDGEMAHEYLDHGAGEIREVLQSPGSWPKTELFDSQVPVRNHHGGGPAVSAGGQQPAELRCPHVERLSRRAIRSISCSAIC